MCELGPWWVGEVRIVRIKTKRPIYHVLHIVATYLEAYIAALQIESEQCIILCEKIGPFDSKKRAKRYARRWRKKKHKRNHRLPAGHTHWWRLEWSDDDYYDAAIKFYKSVNQQRLKQKLWTEQIKVRASCKECQISFFIIFFFIKQGDRGFTIGELRRFT